MEYMHASYSSTGNVLKHYLLVCTYEYTVLCMYPYETKRDYCPLNHISDYCQQLVPKNDCQQ